VVWLQSWRAFQREVLLLDVLGRLAAPAVRHGEWKSEAAVSGDEGLPATLGKETRSWE
jgi:hypothetical protein